MKHLLTYWGNNYYTVVISFLLSAIGLFVSISKRKQNEKLQPLIFFFLGYVLNQLIYFYDIAAQVPQPLRGYLFFYPDFVDTIIEFLAFFYVIKNHIVSNKIRKTLNFLLPAFIGTLLFYFLYYKIAHGSIVAQYFLQVIFTMQAFFLIAACILYYIDLFTKEPKLNLTADPSFWAITGLAFFAVCTLPYSVLGLYLIKTNFHLYVQLFTIFEVFYWILFSMVIKAYLCKLIPA